MKNELLLILSSFLIGLTFLSGCVQNRRTQATQKSIINEKSIDQNKETRPNIIVIMADDMGYEAIRANGGESYQTPEFDKMAAEGIRMEHCYAQPLCTPSRVKLMTGIYNVHNYVEFGILDTTQTTFGHLFKEANYATCIIGKWQLGKDINSPYQAGFDEYCLWQVSKGRTDSLNRDTRFSKPVLEINGDVKSFEDSDYGPDVVSQYGLNFMERAVRKNQPFLLYYPMILTHCPFSPTPDSPEWELDSTAIMTYKGNQNYFGDMVSYTDKIIGNINQKLIELGIEEETLILFTGDNGTDKPVISKMNGRQIAGAKGKSTDAGTRVPLIAKWKGKIPAGQVCHDLIDLSDVLPTICEASNIVPPKNIDGQSFLAQLFGETGQPRDWIYNWYSRSGKIEEARTFVRNHQFKLYTTGELYDVPKDYLEQESLDIKNLSEKAKVIYKDFQELLDYYEKRRLLYIDSK